MNDETTPSPTCPYCGWPSKLVVVALRRYGENVNEMFYRCSPCDAHTGVHPGTTTPVGAMANEELRRKRHQTYEVLATMWHSGWLPRKQAYNWMSQKMGDKTKGNIAAFSLEECDKAYKIIKAQQEKLKAQQPPPAPEKLIKTYTIQSNEFGYPIYASNEDGHYPITDNWRDAAVFGGDNIELKAKVWSAQAGYKFEVVPCES